MSDFPTDAEREAMANVRELTAGLAFGLPPDVEQRVVRDAILTALAPLIRAREAAARAAGRSELIKAMRDATYEAEAECAGRFAARLNRLEADDDRD